jgi:hypothetical protein
MTVSLSLEGISVGERQLCLKNRERGHEQLGDVLVVFPIAMTKHLTEAACRKRGSFWLSVFDSRINTSRQERHGGSVCCAGPLRIKRQRTQAGVPRSMPTKIYF